MGKRIWKNRVIASAMAGILLLSQHSISVFASDTAERIEKEIKIEQGEVENSDISMEQEEKRKDKRLEEIYLEEGKIPSGSAVINKTADIDDIVYVDLSAQIIQEGGFPSITNSPNEGIMLLSVIDNETKKQIQNKLIATWDSISGECDLTEFKITGEELDIIYKETLNQNPRYFYVNGGCSYYYSDELVTIVIPNYGELDITKIKRMLKEYDDVIAQFKSNVDLSWSDMEKVLFINDYLARNCVYGSGHNAYNALVEHSSVCSGYALAFRELAQQLGLLCEIIRSSSLDHAWNLVKIDGSYYHVDVTWNDPKEDRIGRARHQYLMKSSNYFKSQEGGHLKEDDWQITGGLSETVASETKYDDYFWNSVDTGFEYMEGAWYGFDGIDSIKKYTYKEMNFISGETIQKITDVWSVIDGNGSYWVGKYIGLSALNGYLYYSDTDKIYELDVKSKISNILFTLSDEQKQRGHIYGINITPSGEIQYLLSESPNVSGNVYTLDQDMDYKPESKYTFGDINQNGGINSIDAVLTLNYASGLIELDEEQQKLADVNGDGKINSTDAVLILNKASGNILRFPVEQ